MTTTLDEEMDDFFYNNFLSELEEKDPGHFEEFYGVSIKRIKKNPRYFYDLSPSEIAEPVEKKEPIKKDVSVDDSGVVSLL